MTKLLVLCSCAKSRNKIVNLVHLLILVQHLRQFVQKQLVYLLTRYRLVLADYVRNQIPVVTIIETPISDMLGFSPVAAATWVAT